MRQFKINHNITNRESPALEKYLQEISKEKMLTLEEEIELARLIRQGDEKALDKLIKGNLRFVVSVAKHYQHNGMQLIDVINEGNLGLMKAARRYDETRGFKFISYAVWWIRQAIIQALVEHSRIIRLPGNKIDAYQKINKALLQFLQDYERDPTVDELSQMTGLSEKDIPELMKIGSKHVSIDVSLDDENSDSDSLSDMLVSENEAGADAIFNVESLKNEIVEALNYLTDREKGILICFYGLGDTAPMDLEEIAEKFEISKERVRQVKERAIRRLRRTSRSKLLKSYLN
ncbi:MAG: RNA polymerase sigma factor RpoD/SigA [Sphingobacteriales bacterium]|nr:MAG: RNA polymerase sigma factor RpoD/SigA [Sphingobacteriales bacterium]